MIWFRHYNGLSIDPKLTAVAMIADVHHCLAGLAWVYILEHANAADDRGSVANVSPLIMAVGLRMEVSQAKALLAAMGEIGMIKDGRVAAWEKRQRGSDDVAKRVAAWRKRAKTPPAQNNTAITVPLCERESNVTFAQIREDKTLSPIQTQNLLPKVESYTNGVAVENPESLSRASAHDEAPQPTVRPATLPPPSPIPRETEVTKGIPPTAVAGATLFGWEDEQERLTQKVVKDPLGYAFSELAKRGVARSLVGKWKAKLKHPAEDLVDILEAMERENPDEPVAWFVAACKARTQSGPVRAIPESSRWQFLT